MKIKSFPVSLKQLIFSTYLGLMAVLETDGVSQYRARDTRMLHNYIFGSANTNLHTLLTCFKIVVKRKRIMIDFDF